MADEVSLKDVADRAGVSLATASRALRGLSSVAAPTRDKVELAARELGYVAAFNASSFASGKTNSIGFVVPFVDRWFFSKVIVNAEQELRRYGFDLVLYSVGLDDEQRHRFFTELPVRRRVDALAVLCLPLRDHEIAALEQLRIPIATLGVRVSEHPGVRIDDYAAATTAVHHLINLGHRDIGIITGQGNVDLGFTAGTDRLKAYQDTLRSAGVEPRAEWRADGDFTAAGGDQAMSQLLSRFPAPTAVFAVSDEMAFGALGSLRRHGLRVPEDISLIGFDDHELAEPMELTTVAQPVPEQGRLLGRLLLEQLSGPGAPQQDILLPTHLAVRRSTARVSPVR
ncbi:LacI family DNA-binding transcriptional regulator [Lentzea sp. HUAS12]|uniref:LacI family DNA-binding transcriptional regulator n=1 Tax=Lentzea sp. HUAS12 TaxID=2951806 RepID=UPI0020A0DE98|nr:LacI family DNA-binding transcriptional regulator [Lentzea sp. HUAS12]USX54032.1 LacI family transcriptional regulator [Lentzea sp. HUAS12]